VSRRTYNTDLITNHKLIVGEGESDRNFFAAFCVRNQIEGFAYAFTGMHSDKFNPSGFDTFGRYLVALERVTGFDSLEDIVLVFDSTDSPIPRLAQLIGQIKDANLTIGRKVYSEHITANQVAADGALRLHALMVPKDAWGGLETVCFNVARDHLNQDNGKGTLIEGWVNSFADQACVGWTTEKRDKLRLQAFMSAAWRKKPEMHFSQLFDMTQDKLVPLNGAAFGDIRSFLTAVAALK
jgi:hypothetical protein